MNILKKTLKIALLVLLAIIFVASLLVIATTITQKNKGYSGIFGYTFEVVQTDSMSGTFEVDDLIIGKVIDENTEIKERDVISFRTTVNGQIITKTHRVNKAWQEGTVGMVYETWGDNRTSCPSPDSQYVSHDDVISVYTGKKIDGIGKVLNALKTPAGYLALAIPIGIYILYELFALISIFMANKKEEMLSETESAKDAIIREYLAAQAAKEAAEKAAAETNPAPTASEEAEKSPDPKE